MNAAVEEDVMRVDEPPRAGLWFDQGLYYVELTHPASEEPIRVALHGIRTAAEAAEAMCALAGPAGGTEAWCAD